MFSFFIALNNKTNLSTLNYYNWGFDKQNNEVLIGIQINIFKHEHFLKTNKIKL
jgi:hypothetical protein